jgi:hypothetical protein
MLNLPRSAKPLYGLRKPNAEPFTRVPPPPAPGAFLDGRRRRPKPTGQPAARRRSEGPAASKAQQAAYAPSPLTEDLTKAVGWDRSDHGNRLNFQTDGRAFAIPSSIAFAFQTQLDASCRSGLFPHRGAFEPTGSARVNRTSQRGRRWPARIKGAKPGGSAKAAQPAP